MVLELNYTYFVTQIIFGALNAKNFWIDGINLFNVFKINNYDDYGN